MLFLDSQPFGSSVEYFSVKSTPCIISFSCYVICKSSSNHFNTCQMFPSVCETLSRYCGILYLIGLYSSHTIPALFIFRVLSKRVSGIWPILCRYWFTGHLIAQRDSKSSLYTSSPSSYSVEYSVTRPETICFMIHKTTFDQPWLSCLQWHACENNQTRMYRQWIKVQNVQYAQYNCLAIVYLYSILYVQSRSMNLPWSVLSCLLLHLYSY